MKLIEAIRDLDFLGDENTIYAVEPWTQDSQVIVVPEPDAGGLPAEARKLGMKYFLEVFLIRDFLSDWVSNLKREPTLQEKCTRLIQYAVTDA